VLIPKEKMKDAKQALDKIIDDLDNEFGFVGFGHQLQEDGLWIYGEDNFDSEHAHRLVKQLVETLDLPKIHVCSWSYTCSKPRIGDFGGGAFVVQKGIDTVWVDAQSTAVEMALKKRKNLERKNAKKIN
jgi:hypothetical protein